MHAPKTFLIASFLALFSITTAAPAPADDVPGDCIVPAIAFTTIEEPFSLTALIDKPIDQWWVQLQSPSADRETEPFITRAKIAPSYFRLTNGTLTAGGADHNEFPAYFGPTIAIFPPVLEPLQFGGFASPEDFFAGYACDAKGKIYLELRTNERKCLPHFFSSMEHDRCR